MQLAELLQVNDTLQRLHLANCDLKMPSLVGLATVLQQNTAVTVLDVQRSLVMVSESADGSHPLGAITSAAITAPTAGAQGPPMANASSQQRATTRPHRAQFTAVARTSERDERKEVWTLIWNIFINLLSTPLLSTM